jgi:ParB-like chromosome segregation protein Spo0J
MSYDVHPVADLFPMLPDDELKDLAGDIAERGLLQPIVLDTERRVLDGRNRLRACEIAGVKPEFATYDGDDPDGYALAVNIARRHLTKGQIAMVAARSLFVSNNGQARIAEAAKVSQPRIAKAKTVLDHAPDLADAVVAGAVSIDSAYDTARDRKKAAADTEAQMARLRADAPDLADLVTEERMALAEALAALRAREAQRESERRAARSNLSSVLTYLTSTSIEPADLAADYGAVLDEFDADDLAFAADTMHHISQLRTDR